MRGIRFKNDCIKWIREGIKKTTYRKTRRNGEYEIVKGSWFKPERLGMFVRCKPILEINSIVLVSWFWWLEGDFKSTHEFQEWLIKNKLFKKLPIVGWLNSVEYLWEKDVKINKEIKEKRALLHTLI